MRWIIRIFLTLLTFVVVAIAAVFLIPAEKIARIAETQFEKNTGRSLSITGGVSPTLWPRLGVTLEGVTISNADWAGDAPMVQTAKLDVGVGLAALLGGDIEVQGFSIENPVILLEKRADGVANWEFLSELGGSEDAGDGSGINSLSLPKGVITGAIVRYRDAVTGVSETLENLDAEVSLTGLGGEATVTMSALRNGQAFALDARVDGVQQLLDGEVRGVVGAASSGPNTVKFDGAAGLTPLQAKGALDVAIKDQTALFGLLGQSAPRIPEGLGQQVELRGDLTLTPDLEVFLRQATIALDQNILKGDVDVALGGSVPQVTARLAGDQLDFSAMSTDTTEGDGAANAGAGGWSDARIDVSGLSAAEGSFTFKANAVDLGSIQLGQSEIAGTLDRSRLVLDFKQLSAFDGSVTGQFVVNNRSGLSVGGDMTASGVAMQQVLNDFAGFDRLVGDAALSLQFLGVGQTLDQIMKSLSGSGRMDVGAGELLGLDIAGMIRNLDASYQGEGSKTVFDDITASFNINDGILRNDDLRFEASLLTADGAGALDLGGQTIDYRVVPVALATQIDNGISVPVLITGPWSNIKFRPDLKSLIDRELEEEKEKLKAAAKAKEAELRAAAKAREAELKAQAAAKLEDELGVTRETGQSAEDALKQGLEDKAKDALRKLFD
ncbi:AsmA family protein [uncultured Litoreibacter sp.]|uniref:AsmA family protein n=1 Tax=uncultured Litoreibacter sp. TaxID=1392394 RepID=UPI0026263316|nr:AsmA family protein [uncultured Litoreibacter sp.]